MDPINYSGTFADLQSPNQAFTQGLQSGALLQQAQMAQAQQQAVLAQQQQKRAVLADLVSKGANATADDYVKAGLQVPELSKQFKEFWDMKNTAQQQSELQRIMGWTAAIDSGQPKIASDGMRAQADAIENTAGGATQESKGLRAKADQVDANPQASNVILKSMLAAHPDGKKAIEGITALAVEDRAAKAAPTELSTKQADLALKNLGIVGQKAGALATVKGVKPSQAATMFQSLEARGIIPKGGAQDYIDGIPTDPKDLPDYLASVRDAGIKPDEQKKFTTPDANAQLSARTQVQTTGMNNSTQLKVQDRIDARAKAESEGSDDVASFTPQAIDNAAARYNTDGTLPPMGMGKAAAAGRTKILNRAAEMKLGVSPEQQRIDQLSNKGDIAARNASVLDFSAKGKSGQALQAANTSLNHLETVEQLALAQKNGNVRLFNQMANKLAAEFGGTAPTNLNAALSMVAPEVSKAVIGAAGTGEERAAFEHRFAGNGSPEQALQGIGTVKELLGGRLTEAQRTYERTTKKTDFDSMLSPAAKKVLDRAHHAAHDGPAIGTVDGGFRFKGGDPSKQSSWEKI